MVPSALWSAALLGLAVAMTSLGVLELAWGRRRTALRSLAGLRTDEVAGPGARGRLLDLIRSVGASEARSRDLRLRLARAGFRDERGAALYTGVRIVLP